MTEANDPEVATALEALQGALGDIAFALSGPEDDSHEFNRRRLVKSIHEYALPRVTRSASDPVVVLIAGSSGVGKSTVLNSLVQSTVSPVSLSRPTTRHPVVWASRRPGDDAWSRFIGRVQDVLGRNVDILVGDGELASDIVLIDTPPLDHRRGSYGVPTEDMLTLADLCIFVTSASRYADAIPFEFLASANRQGVPALFVLNKAPVDPWNAVDLVNDFAARLSRRGLLLTPNPNLIFRLTHDPLPRSHQGLDGAAISALREELEALADPDFREEIVRQTTSASLRSIGDLGAELATDLRVDAAHAADLREAVGDAYLAQSLRLEEELDSGAFAAVARRKSSTEAAAELAGIVTRRAGVASGRAAGSWERLPGGAILLGRGGTGLYRHGEDTPYEAVEIIEEWEQASIRHAEGESSGRSSRWTRRRLGRFLWRATLDPDRKAPGAVARRFGGDTDKVVLAARELLAAAFVAALSHDAERFRRLIRDPVPDDRITTLEATIAELVRVTGSASTASLDPESVTAAPTTAALTTSGDAPRGSTSA